MRAVFSLDRIGIQVWAIAVFAVAAHQPESADGGYAFSFALSAGE
jgi:hypothetical protein